MLSSFSLTFSKRISVTPLLRNKETVHKAASWIAKPDNAEAVCVLALAWPCPVGYHLAPHAMLQVSKGASFLLKAAK